MPEFMVLVHERAAAASALTPTVLGTAPDERSWIEVMDRMDERAHGRFPEHRFAAERAWKRRAGAVSSALPVAAAPSTMVPF